MTIDDKCPRCTAADPATITPASGAPRWRICTLRPPAVHLDCQGGHSMRLVSGTILVWAALLFLPAVSSAQGTSSGAIAGTARDSSGAVLPGVTVEASSPALIEKSRT